ncbi:hypothetical protein [Streptomyces sp. KL116D]|uniref:hypothetical protein n=1 Tax=Streptomyces sp. KL116D TaxID=3045152 RepID=UPI003557D6C1
MWTAAPKRGQCSLFEPNAIRDQDVSTGWFVEAGSLEDWLETWLDGRGWYEEGTGAGPAKDRWAEASERLWPGVS